MKKTGIWCIWRCEDGNDHRNKKRRRRRYWCWRL